MHCLDRRLRYRSADTVAWACQASFAIALSTDSARVSPINSSSSSSTMNGGAIHRMYDNGAACEPLFRDQDVWLAPQVLVADVEPRASESIHDFVQYHDREEGGHDASDFVEHSIGHLAEAGACLRAHAAGVCLQEGSGFVRGSGRHGWGSGSMLGGWRFSNREPSLVPRIEKGYAAKSGPSKIGGMAWRNALVPHIAGSAPAPKQGCIAAQEFTGPLGHASD